MEWSKLYSNENNEHLPYEDFLALNEAALTIPVTEWLYLGRNQPLIPRQNQIPGKHFVDSQTDYHNFKKQRVNPTTSTTGGNPVAKGVGKYGKKKQQPVDGMTPGPYADKCKITFLMYKYITTMVHAEPAGRGFCAQSTLVTGVVGPARITPQF